MKDDYIKKKASGAFVNVFGGSTELLSKSDIYCRVLDRNKTPIAYLDIIVVRKLMSGSNPLIAPKKTIQKLIDKRLNPVILWAFLDGIVYCKVKNISGEVLFGSTDSKSPEEL